MTHIKGTILSIRDHGEIVFVDTKVNKIKSIDIPEEIYLTKTNSSDCEYQLKFLLKDFDNIDIEKQLSIGSSISAIGTTINREDADVNSKKTYGEVELLVSSFDVNKSKQSPIDDSTKDPQKLLEYRTLQLRQDSFQDMIKFKSDVMKKIRRNLEDFDFTEVETPILTRSTPGGAKDFQVLSSQHKTSSYGMVQSPQMFKQLLMTTGLQKYYQFAKCFRDEELRSDRQPEFLQLDLEMAWATSSDIINVVETSLGLSNVNTITYKEAMDLYGCDKPDVRFDLKLNDVSDIFSNSSFDSFKGKSIKSITIPADFYSKKKRKEIEKLAFSLGAKGLGYFLINEDGMTSPLEKFFTEDEVQQVIDRCSQFKNNEIIYFVADDSMSLVNKIISELRLKFGHDLYKDEIVGKLEYLWVVDFPMFEEKDDGSISSSHHPFTKPLKEDWEAFKVGTLDKLDIRTHSYDLVLNGSEIGGGSERIANPSLQEDVFNELNLPENEYNSLSWFVELLSYGTPPHAGFALGVDRYVVCLKGKKDIRESIAFPKDGTGKCPMTNAPSLISNITDYGFRIRREN